VFPHRGDESRGCTGSDASALRGSEAHPSFFAPPRLSHFLTSVPYNEKSSPLRKIVSAIPRPESLLKKTSMITACAA